MGPPGTPLNALYLCHWLTGIICVHGLKGIALSGYGMMEDVQRSREAGFETHLTKPVNFSALIATIQKVLS